MRKDFMKLEVWKKAHLLVLEIYKHARKLPDRDEEFGVAYDICHTALQVPANIARGCALEEESEYRDCLEEARVTLRHVDMQLMALRDLGHLTSGECDRLLEMGETVRDLLVADIEGRKRPAKT